MSKPEWGIKRLCPSCGIKYYDFNREIIKCPKCEFEFDPDLLLKSRKGRGVATKSDEESATNNVKEENETLEENVAILDSEEEIFDEETNDNSDIDENELGVNISEGLENNIQDEEIDIIEDEKDENFSIEINEDDDKKEN